MITARDLYHVLTAVVPLYVAMTLAYGSVRWWHIFTPDQCSGINRFVALFAVPLLSFHFISTNNPFAMNLRFLAADTLQKLIVLAFLALASRLSHFLSLDWSITLFSLSTLPNTLVMGIPLLRGMYGPDSAGTLMVQVVVLQCIIWYTLMLFLFEYRAARSLVMDHFPGGAAADIVSFRVDSDVVSLAGKEDLEADAHVAEDGRVRVTVRKSTSSRSEAAGSHSQYSQSMQMQQPRVSNLSGVEIYSLQSSRNPTPRGSSFNHAEFFNIVKGGGDEEKGATGRHSPAAAKRKDLHMFVWSSSASPVSDRAAAGAVHAFGSDHGDVLAKGGGTQAYDEYGRDDFSRAKNGNGADKGGPALSKLGSNSTAQLYPKDDGEGRPAAMPPASVMTRLILIMVWRKLIRNPNTYSSLIGIIWSLAALPQGIVPFVFAKEYNVHPNILSTAVIFGMLIALPITLVYYILLGL
nr:unnamed protein product [Digitaria exilis]